MQRQRFPVAEEPGATYFVTFVLYDRALCDLSSPRYARLIINALRHFDKERYLLFDFVVMPDHVHFLLKPLERNGIMSQT